jgi:hypothetical protein
MASTNPTVKQAHYSNKDDNSGEDEEEEEEEEEEWAEAADLEIDQDKEDKEVDSMITNNQPTSLLNEEQFLASVLAVKDLKKASLKELKSFGDSPLSTDNAIEQLAHLHQTCITAFKPLPKKNSPKARPTAAGYIFSRRDRQAKNLKDEKTQAWFKCPCPSCDHRFIASRVALRTLPLKDERKGQKLTEKELKAGEAHLHVKYHGLYWTYQPANRNFIGAFKSHLKMNWKTHHSFGFSMFANIESWDKEADRNN